MPPLKAEIEEPATKDSSERFNSKQVLRLVRSAGNGEPEALDEFFKLFAEDVYNFPMRVFHLDQDQASDYFLYAYERLKDGQRFKSFKGKSSFRTWFYTVLRNLVIDWMRTIKEVQTVSAGRVSDDGKEYSTIENTPDPRLEKLPVLEMLDSFTEKLEQVPIEMRAVFKLTYIYYLNLNEPEIVHIASRANISKSALLKKISSLKHTLSLKELGNIEEEDKITSIYMGVLDLKARRERLVQKKDNPTMEYELGLLDQAIEKKYRQRQRLLDKKEKGLFVVRTPYKFITELLGIPEGSISVIMMKVIEQIKAA